MMRTLSVLAISTLEEELASLAIAPGTRATRVHRDTTGALRITSRESLVCPPQVTNMDEVALALNRAQSQMNAAGRVIIRVQVDESGAPADVVIVESSGHDFIDAAATGVGYVMRFTPAYNDGRAVRVWARFPITFVRQRS